MKEHIINDIHVGSQRITLGHLLRRCLSNLDAPKNYVREKRDKILIKNYLRFQLFMSRMMI